MEIKADLWMPFARPLVFTTYRDKLPDLVPRLPNIRSLEVKERHDDGHLTRLRNVWTGGGEIPKAARAIISESMLSWTDHASWDQAQWACDWRIETHAFTEAVSCAGRNTFVEERDGTRVVIRGTLVIDGRKVRGVPGFLAARIGKIIEDFLATRIEPNMVATAKSVRRFLEEGAADKG
jgi:hypothetical protein